MTARPVKIYLIIILIFASVLAFWRIGAHDLLDWDESRNGVNAYEMYHNGDYVNLYYAHDLDTWNAKPPLMIWLIALSYKIFGFGEFALRLPAALSAILFFVYFFKLVALLEDDLKAFVSCLVLLSCKAVFGTHIGITGDFDALLLALLTGATYYFARYIVFEDKKGIYLFSLFMGLAFYTKGTAAFVLVPGLILYAIFSSRIKYLVKQRHTWLAALLFCCIAASWVALVALYGKSSDHSYYGSKNSLETMLIHDTWRRLTSTGFEHTYKPDHLFVFTTLDARINLWNYFFYISLVIGLVALYQHRRHLLAYINNGTNRMSLLSLCLIAPLFIVMTLATNKHDWYLAPVFCYVVFIIVKGMFFIIKRWKPFRFVLIGLLLFTLGREFYYLNTLSTSTHTAMHENKYLLGAPHIITVGQPTQSMFLYLEWLNVPIIKVNDLNEASQHKDDLIFVQNVPGNSLTAFNVLQSFDENYIIKPKG